MRKSTKITAVLFSMILALSFAVDSQAQSTGTFTVDATVLSVCNVTGLVPLVFGNYDPSSGTDLTGATTLTVLCNVPYEIGIDECGGASTSARQMAEVLGSDTLDFSLTCATEGDTSCTANWGNVDGTDTLSGGASVVPVNVTVDGTVPSGQNPNPGAYQATCTANLYF